ncbi:MAG TPA: hypothetical protein VLI54_03320 [Bacillota bacterium]|nr:hypothetical protein [Bacillota bacterium]
MPEATPPNTNNPEPANIEGNTTLMAEWSELARPAFIEPTYQNAPTLDKHLAAEQPKEVARQQAGSRMYPWQTKRLERATESYPAAVEQVTKSNTKAHDTWRTSQTPVVTELYGLAIAGGHQEVAEQYQAEVEQRGIDTTRSDKLGLAFLAGGHADRAKTILMGRRDPSAVRHQAHSLLDAYLWTSDPDYRARLLTVLPQAQFLVAQLATFDMAHERPVDDLFDVADAKSGARLVLALTVTAAEADPKGAFERYIQRTLPSLKAPTNKMVTPVVAPPPPQPTLADRAKQKIEEDGIIGVALEAPFAVFESGLDLLFGGNTSPAPAPAPRPPKPRPSPEYRKFLDNTAPLIARADPWLQSREDYTDEGYGNLSIFKAGDRQALLQAQANGGNSAAALRLLEIGRGSDNARYYAYRNLLRGAGSAAVHLTRLSGENRRVATYYTLVAAAARGEALPPPPIYDIKDTFGQLQALYRQVDQAAATYHQETAPTAPSSHATRAALELTDLRLLDRAGVNEVLARIRSLNDPAAEQAALAELARQLEP